MKRYVLDALLIVSLILWPVVLTAAGQGEAEGKTALMLIDIQDFYFPGGSLPLSGPEAAAEEARRVLDRFRERGLPVIHVRHQSRTGAGIHRLVQPREGETVVTKTEVNAFKGTDLLKRLRSMGVKNLVFCGMQTHMCLEAAVRAAHDFDFGCTVIQDACATRDLKFGDRVVPAADVHASTLATLSGTYAEVMSAEAFLGLNRKDTDRSSERYRPAAGCSLRVSPAGGRSPR